MSLRQMLCASNRVNGAFRAPNFTYSTGLLVWGGGLSLAGITQNWVDLSRAHQACILRMDFGAIGFTNRLKAVHQFIDEAPFKWISLWKGHWSTNIVKPISNVPSAQSGIMRLIITVCFSMSYELNQINPVENNMRSMPKKSPES